MLDNAPLFSLTGLQVTPHLLLLSLGIVLCLVWAVFMMKQEGLPEKTIALFCLVVIPLSLVFARLGYGLVNLHNTLDRPARLLNLQEGGFTLYGAGLGLVLAALAAARLSKIRFLRLMDVLAPACAMIVAVSRLLEGFIGLGYSFYVDNPALHFFPLAVYDDYWETWALALFVLEGLYALGLAFWLTKNRSAPGSGDRFSLLLLMYAVMQIWFESLRRDAYARVGFIRVMQLISAILAGAVLLYWLIRARKPLWHKAAAFTAYLVLLGIVMLMEFAVEYKVGFLLALHQRWGLSQTAHYALSYGVMLLAVLAALLLGLAARQAALKTQNVIDR